MGNNKIKHHLKAISKSIPSFSIGMGTGIILLGILSTLYILLFEKKYEGRIYPNVYIDEIPFAGQTPELVSTFWETRSHPFQDKFFEFQFEHHIATVSAQQLGLRYDAKLSATQAYLIGRSGLPLSDLYTRLFNRRIELNSLIRWDNEIITEAITQLSAQIDIPVQEALFQFENNKVTAFKPSSPGRMVNRKQTADRFESSLHDINLSHSQFIRIPVIVDAVTPNVTTDQANEYGVKELIGKGYSEFSGSIPGRIHNIALAASRVNGILIKPGETFSFARAIGDISAATGYQSAYIIKDGRTVLGDGGGVCQVSSTLFRAALDAGLPIAERHGHAYRVHYYEDGGFKPGLDATVFVPSVDLKFKNDTAGHILIQAKPNMDNLTLAFEMYGTRDGRTSEILNHKVWGETPPPPPLYQDDPTLAPGQVRQVDFSAWGAQASFDYRVTRGNEILQNETFKTSFRPWQAVFLRGPQI